MSRTVCFLPAFCLSRETQISCRPPMPLVTDRHLSLSSSLGSPQTLSVPSLWPGSLWLELQVTSQPASQLQGLFP